MNLIQLCPSHLARVLSSLLESGAHLRVRYGAVVVHAIVALGVADDRDDHLAEYRIIASS